MKSRAIQTQDLPSEIYKSLFKMLLRIRIVEEKIVEVYPQQEMRCPVHLCIGQEAIAVGVCANLTRDDYVLSNHRSHGHYLAKGGDLKAMMAEIYGKATGCCQGKGGSMHLTDLPAGFIGATPIVSSTIPVAVGTAFGTVMRGEKRVSVVFFGDAATEEGVFHESLNFAALKKLPVIFVCENNLYSVYSPLSVRQPEDRDIYRLAKSYGVRSYQGDGNDVVEVYKMSRRAVKRAREGKGPVFLEFKTYRWREHCGPNYDNDLGYRTQSEFQEWRRLCPVEKLQAQLVEGGILSQHDVDRMISEIRTEMEDAIAFAKESPFPDESNLMKSIYCS